MEITMRLSTALPLVLLAACTGDVTSSSTSLTRAPGECSEVEVHVIGVNDVGDGGGDGGGGGTIILSRPGRHMLVLSAYAATTWEVQVSPEATLDRVYAVGHYPQTVTTNVTTKINTESEVEGGAGATGYAYPDQSTDALLKLASIRLKLHATSFHGCYSASKWTIGEDMAVTSDCTTSTGTTGGTYTQYDAVTDCDGDNACGSPDGAGALY